MDTTSWPTCICDTYVSMFAHLLVQQTRLDATRTRQGESCGRVSVKYLVMAGKVGEFPRVLATKQTKKKQPKKTQKSFGSIHFRMGAPRWLTLLLM
eukprot:949282-Amphidinium_carterae.2